LGAAILGALTDIDARFIWIHPHVVFTVGDQVSLSSQPRDPKTMVGIRGEQSDKGGCGMCRVAGRDVKLICGDHPKSWITKLPPELMTDGNDFDGFWRFLGLLDAMDYTSSSEKKYEHNEHRNYRPGELYLVAAVDWWRLTAVIIGAPAELNNGICEEREHYYKNHGADGQYEK